MRARYDLRCSGLAAIAAALAAIGLLGAYLDHGFAGRDVSAVVLGATAVVAASLAFVPGGPTWSDRRRAIAIWYAVAAVVVSLPLELFVGARGACGCEGAAGELPPAGLGGGGCGGGLSRGPRAPARAGARGGGRPGPWSPGSPAGASRS